MNDSENTETFQIENTIESLESEIRYWQAYGKNTESLISSIRDLLIYEENNEKLRENLGKLMYGRFM